MQALRIILGKMLFWASWPALYIYLKDSTRSRVLLEHNGNILLLRGWYDGNKWSLPGGGLHAHESAKASAIRETYEEVGIKLEEGSLLDLGDDVYSSYKLHFKIKRFGYKLKFLPKTVKQHIEVISLTWLELDSITQNMVDDATWRHITAWKQHR